jgi:ATP/maltotriose-dependent transcriptional regulator MalT
VTDTGKGIPEKDISNLFKPFYQASNNDQAAQGVGLGLYISKRLRLDAEKQLEGSLEQALLISNRQGEILFATRQAQILLDTFFSAAPKHRLPVELQNWLTGGDNQRPLSVSHGKRGEIEIDHFAVSTSGTLSLMRMEHRNGDKGPKALLALGLTAREAEVLYWISEGKTNPEIAIILDSSINTVKNTPITCSPSLVSKPGRRQPAPP